MRAPPLGEPRVRTSLGGALRFWGSDRLPFGVGPVPPTRGFKPRALMLGRSRFRHRPALAGPPPGQSRGRSATFSIRMRVASKREAFPNRSVAPDIDRRREVAERHRPTFEPPPRAGDPAHDRFSNGGGRCAQPPSPTCFRAPSLSGQGAGTMRRIWTADLDPNIRIPIGRFPVTTSPTGVREATNDIASAQNARGPVKCGTRNQPPENQTPETIPAVT